MELPASGGATLRRRTGISRSFPSQGSLSKYSTRDTKRNMYVSSPKKSIRAHRTEGAVSGRLRTVCPRCESLGSKPWPMPYTYYVWHHKLRAWRASPAMVILWVGRTGGFLSKRKCAPPDSDTDRLRLETLSHPGGRRKPRYLSGNASRSSCACAMSRRASRWHSQTLVLTLLPLGGTRRLQAEPIAIRRRALPFNNKAAHLANPEADHRRGGSPSTLLVITNITCMCHLPNF